MGILNKLLFWRRDDEMDFDAIADEQYKTGKDSLGLDPEVPDFEEKPFFPNPEP